MTDRLLSAKTEFLALPALIMLVSKVFLVNQIEGFGDLVVYFAMFLYSPLESLRQEIVKVHLPILWVSTERNDNGAVYLSPGGLATTEQQRTITWYLESMPYAQLEQIEADSIVGKPKTGFRLRFRGIWFIIHMTKGKIDGMTFLDIANLRGSNGYPEWYYARV